MRNPVLLALALLFAPPAFAAEGEGVAAPLDWQHWQAGNEVSNTASLQRGARNFFGYCAGCHSLKYVRYSRLATDLRISIDQLRANLLPAGATPADYVKASLAPADGVAWFGKVPPDLSLIARSRGTDHIYQFLKTFYVDPASPTRTNNLALSNAAMPAVLSDLEGVKEAVFRNVEVNVDGKASIAKRFDHFVTVAPGQLNEAQFDGFVRDTVNFLDYAGEPAQVDRRSIGVWVVLFLLVFTWVALLLKKEYWKDVHCRSRRAWHAASAAGAPGMASRRSVMTLFSAPDEPQSHRVRVVLAEKASEIDIISVVPGRYPEDLLDLNPYRSLPTLVDRDLVLYDARVIIDYLDERFPHPPLMPVDPVLRAQFRLAMYRVERDWYGLAEQIERESDRKNQARLKKELRDTMLQSADLFKIKPFFLSDEFSVVDATIAPIIWRMRRYEIELPPQAQAMSKYAAMILARPSVRASLSDAEIEMGVN